MCPLMKTAHARTRRHNANTTTAATPVAFTDNFQIVTSKVFLSIALTHCDLVASFPRQQLSRKAQVFAS